MGKLKAESVKQSLLVASEGFQIVRNVIVFNRLALDIPKLVPSFDDTKFQLWICAAAILKCDATFK